MRIWLPNHLKDEIRTGNFHLERKMILLDFAVRTTYWKLGSWLQPATFSWEFNYNLSCGRIQQHGKRLGLSTAAGCVKCEPSRELESWDPLAKTKNKQVGSLLKERVNKKSSWKTVSSSVVLEFSWHKVSETRGEFSPWTWEWQRRGVWKLWEWAQQQLGPTILNDQD